MAVISVGTTSTTGLQLTSDTTGTLVLKIANGATTAATLDASGNLGLGVTPSAWGSGNKALQVSGGAIWTPGTVDTRLSNNQYRNAASSRIYIANGYAQEYAQDSSGNHVWQIAPSGTAGNPITFTQAMTLNASGNLQIAGGSTNTTYTSGGQLALKRSNSSPYMSFHGDDGTRIGYVQLQQTGASSLNVEVNQPLSFATNALERMRITANGDVAIGKATAAEGASSGSGYGFAASSTDPFFSVVNANASGGNACIYLNRRTAGSLVVFMTNDGSTNTTVGSISHNGSATAYNTTSDYRLKTNLEPLSSAVDRLKALCVHRFNWLSNPDGPKVDGFLAHEAQAVVPECVTGEKDEIDADGNPVYQGIDQSKLVPLLTAAIQEQQAMIDDLKAEVATLKGAA